MTEGPIERASIRADVRNTAWTSNAHFTLVDSTGNSIMESFDFKPQGRMPANRDQQRKALDDLLKGVREDGWQIVARPHDDREWWAFQFARGDREQVERERVFVRQSAPHPTTASSAGGIRPAVWWMWGLTILVIIGLFACCVILVATSELRLSPG